MEWGERVSIREAVKANVVTQMDVYKGTTSSKRSNKKTIRCDTRRPPNAGDGVQQMCGTRLRVEIFAFSG